MSNKLNERKCEELLAMLRELFDKFEDGRVVVLASFGALLEYATTCEREEAAKELVSCVNYLSIKLASKGLNSNNIGATANIKAKCGGEVTP